ncbi:hypothetical protein N7481_010539 [Penicillium waksmanii]|uniref:uncharacterized protein n=1 Tax=Penicillium waksmanii TaxID=69791 RepID=UPI0025482D5A|nr:uncharacterized protein N7481_010539 [Penicillium waksmanii]KAJ5973329.1 hypothetical protein N7481_010539 [Penicillium waksmanii]
MSSHSDNIDPPSSSQFVPPASAQPYRSIFGGPSSDAGPPLSSPQPGPSRRSIFGGPRSSSHFGPRLDPMSEGPEDDDFEAFLRDRPLEADYNSEGESFQGSSDGEDGLGLESEPDLPQKKPLSRTSSYSPSKSVSLPPPPTTYVLDRGLDLPPGVPRPNRWTGPPRTYRQLISDEKGAYDAILANRSMDLAAHLYDSFVLRNQNQKAGEVLGPEDESEDPAAVKKVWVGWPMLANNVPRSDEYIRRQLDDPDTYRMAPDPRPSADLEESIIASMLKTAKENFMASQWDEEEVRTHRAPRLPEEEDYKMDTEDEMKHYESAYGSGIDQEPLRPVFQADDDTSRRQLRPLSRNVISHLDRVLMGLHHAMQGRTRDQQHTDGEFGSDDEDEASRSHSRHGSCQKGKKSSRASSVHNKRRRRSQHSSDEDETTTRGPDKKSMANHYVFQRGEQRDWSEVMGIAAMTGLPSDAVMRASKRCADLFGQDMTFRRFHEGRMHKTEALDHGESRTEYIESDTEGENVPAPYPKRSRKKKRGHGRDDGSDQGPSVALKLKGKGTHRRADIVCPIATCPRHTDGFSRTWNLTLHLRKAHGRERERTDGSQQRGAAIQID